MQDFRMLVLTPSTVHHHNGGGEVYDLYTTARYTIYTPQKVGAYVLRMGHPSGLGICCICVNSFIVDGRTIVKSKFPTSLMADSF